jgi:hypothetical protein
MHIDWYCSAYIRVVQLCHSLTLQTPRCLWLETAALCVMLLEHLCDKAASHIHISLALHTSTPATIPTVPAAPLGSHAACPRVQHSAWLALQQTPFPLPAVLRDAVAVGNAPDWAHDWCAPGAARSSAWRRRWDAQLYNKNCNQRNHSLFPKDDYPTLVLGPPLAIPIGRPVAHLPPQGLARQAVSLAVPTYTQQSARSACRTFSCGTPRG